MKYRYIMKPGTTSYRAPKRELSPDYYEKLRRWREKRDAELRRRFPEHFRRSR